MNECFLQLFEITRACVGDGQAHQLWFQGDAHLDHFNRTGNAGYFLLVGGFAMRHVGAAAYLARYQVLIFQNLQY